MKLVLVCLLGLTRAALFRFSESSAKRIVICALALLSGLGLMVYCFVPRLDVSLSLPVASLIAQFGAVPAIVYGTESVALYCLGLDDISTGRQIAKLGKAGAFVSAALIGALLIYVSRSGSPMSSTMVGGAVMQSLLAGYFEMFSLRHVALVIVAAGLAWLVVGYLTARQLRVVVNSARILLRRYPERGTG